MQVHNKLYILTPVFYNILRITEDVGAEVNSTIRNVISSIEKIVSDVTLFLIAGYSSPKKRKCISRGDNPPKKRRGRKKVAMTTTGAQYALAASNGANSSGDIKPNVVVVTSPNGNGNGQVIQTQPHAQQLITVVASSDPSSPTTLQPIQVL